VSCEIVRWTDEGFPGWVEAGFIDADGVAWTFTDKSAVFSPEPLDSTSSFPVAGAIRCAVVDEDNAVGRTTIDTSSPDGITAVDGVTTRFTMRSEVVSR
jgi:hypothetical protein